MAPKHMPKSIKLGSLLIIALLFQQCKTTAPTAPTPSTPSLLEVSQILDATDSAFYNFANQTGGNARKAIELTTRWIGTLSNVQLAQALDSSCIQIVLKSGLTTTYFFDELDSAGHSVFRGGKSSDSKPHLVATVPKSRNTITNKNVLIWAAAFSQFYTGPDMQRIVDRMNNAGLGVTATLMQDAACTYQTVDQFANYGLVIMDTHGLPDGFLLGTTLPITDLDTDDSHLEQTIITAIGQDGYDKMISGQLGVLSRHSVYPLEPHWWLKHLPSIKMLFMSSKYFLNLPPLSSTVIMGNMCYSGWQAPTPSGFTAVGSTIINKSPLSYYSYSYDDGKSDAVENLFAQAMEDSLTQQLFVNLDSTGNANLASTNALFYDPYSYYPQNPDGKLWFKHIGALDYSYGGCVQSFTDVRDGQVYQAVCIGNQNWMAQNLNYKAPGSITYNNDPANGAIYGRLYDWATLMQGADSSSKNPSGIQGVCPKGWHIPSNDEYVTMVSVFGGSDPAGGPMKSTSSLWNSPNTGATNSCGFSGLPAGFGDNSTSPATFAGLGTAAQFATATLTKNGNNAIIWTLSSSASNTGETAVPKTSTNSCRCVKDQ
jgi:uncharacterized protein (TIGR02145 family)